MKGQTQALTAVLITTVTVGAIATAYIWGTPILEKRQSQARLQQVEDNVIDLRSEIISLSQSGEGATSTIKLQSEDLRVEVNEEKDYIDVFTNSPRPPYPTGVWTLLKGENLQNLSIGTGSYAVKGEDQPGVLAVKVASGGGSAVVHYRIEFRNMYTETPTGAELRKIDLRSTGSSSAAGKVTLLVSNEGTENDEVKVGTGEQLPRTKRIVEVDLQ